jgi:1,4-dihydroxy-2-naphthoyl-CoA hydrolase
MSDTEAPAARALTDGPDDLVAAMNEAHGGGTLGARMGIVFTEVSADRVVATMPVDGNTQPYGLLHGGASVVLAETLGSVGAMLSAGPGRAAVGVDINATHHRAVRSGVVTGVATPLQAGRTTACYEVVVTDESGRRICTSRITCLLRDAAP